MTSQLGLIGLGTMGRALAQNLASHGFKVSLWNRTHEKIATFIEEHGEEHFYQPKNFEDFVESIERPRRIILMLPSGDALQNILKELAPILERDDCIMDGGNTLFKITEVYQKQLESKGVFLLGTGISGGEEGALKGPCLMPGGPKEAWDEFEDVLNVIAAEDFNGKSCLAFMGKGGAGHYVKMIHNGIEYAEMQMLAEAYDFFTQLYKLKPSEVADIFQKWNAGPLESYLLEMAVDVLQKESEGKPLIDLILDKAGQKGTGAWTVQEALRLGVPVPSIAGAVFMRGISQDKSSRQELEKKYPKQMMPPNVLLQEATDHLEATLLATRISNFEQGFALLKAAEEAEQFGLPFSEIARIWQGGCIIRCKSLKDIEAGLQQEVKSLYFMDFAHKILEQNQKSWRKMVSLAAEHCLPFAVISSALSHFEAHRRGHLPANLIQGLRDRFGAHGYERIDQEGIFHTLWP